MQIKEDLEKNLFHLHAVERRESGDDVKFLKTFVRTTKLHQMFVYDGIEPAKYHGQTKERLALRFYSHQISEAVHLVATDKEDERNLQKIIFVLVDGHVPDRTSRGIYLYRYGIVQNDHRHHLNGFHASICLAFCQHCHNPLVERLEVRQKVCRICAEMPPEELENLIEAQKKMNEKSRPGFKGVWSRLRRLADVAGSQ